MTIICAIRDRAKGVVFVGADTMVSGGERRWQGSSKILQIGDWYILTACTSRMADVLESNYSYLKENETIRGLVEAILKTFKSHELVTPDKNQNDILSFDGILLVVKGIDIWHIGVDGGIIELVGDELHAEGSGARYALGAAHACKGQPIDQLRAALGAAIELDPHCGYGVNILEVTE